MPTSLQIGAKLHHLLQRTNLSEDQFIDQFTRQSNQTLRPKAVQEWLSDTRQPYKATLDKLAAFWRNLIPGFSYSHFLMPLAEFEAALKPRIPTATDGGVVLPLTPAPLLPAQVTTLAGAYRLYRYDASGARVVSEALAIAQKPNTNAPMLEAHLWSPTAKAPQRFNGAVIVMNDHVYLVLSDVDAVSSAMRFISLPGGFNAKGMPWFGIASGVFDKADVLSAMPVALEKMSANATLAAESLDWVSSDAIEVIDKALLLMLQRPLK